MIAVAVGLAIAADGLPRSVRSAPAAEWLPQVAYGAMIVAFVLVATVAAWLGDDPGEADRFVLGHWVVLACFFLCAGVGVAFVAAGYVGVFAWWNLLFGVGGVVLMLREKRRLSRGSETAEKALSGVDR